MANFDTNGIEYIKTDRDSQPSPVLDLPYGGHPYQFTLMTFHYGTRLTGPFQQGRGHRHRVYHMVLYTEGNNRFIHRDRIHRSRPGLLVLTEPGERHQFPPLDKGVVTYHELTFRLDHRAGKDDVTPLPGFVGLTSLYTGRDFSSPDSLFLLSPRQMGWIQLIFGTIRECLVDREERDWFRIKRTILELWGFLGDELYSLPLSYEGTTIDAAGKTRAVLDRRFREGITVPDLAELAGVTPEHLCRQFKTRYGLSPMAYRRRLQISAARTLLADSALPCKEIAHSLGFSDSYAFSRAFKKAVGESPTAYRRRSPGINRPEPREREEPS